MIMIIKNQLLKALVLLIGMISCMACSEQSEDNDNPPQAGSSNLTVTPGKLNFKAEGGTQELRVKTTYEYFGYDFTADWISADFKDDATYNIITVTAKPNTTSSVRKATFKIIGSNSETGVDETVNITIEQEGKNSSGGGKTFTVSAQGGTIEEGNIKINFPSGTYDGDRQVEIKEIEQGKTALEEEVSSFYEVFMPADSKKPLQISIKSDAKGNNISFAAHAPGVALHDINRGVTYSDIHLETKYANGTYTTTVPAINDPENPEGVKVSFGLVKTSSSTYGSANVRTTRSEENGEIKWEYVWCDTQLGETGKNRIESVITEGMNESVKIIKGFGFKVTGDRKIPLNIVNKGLGDKECGRFIQSTIKDDWNSIKFNLTYLIENISNPTDIKRTVIHELFHYFQSEYDPVYSPYLKGGMYGNFLDDAYFRLRAYEAGGVWIEKYVDPQRYYDSGWRKNFGYCFIGPYNEGTTTEADTDNLKGEAAYRAWGYGSAPMLDWFVYEKGTEAILKLYQEFKKGGKTTFKQWIKAGETATQAKFHSKFDEYATKMCEGSLVRGINYKKGVDHGVDTKFGLWDVCDSMKNNQFTKVDDGTKEHVKTVYQYGVRPTYMRFSYSNAEDLKDYAKKQITIEQDNKDLTNKAWFYEQSTGKYTYLGEFKKDDPLVVNDEKILDKLINKPGNPKNYNQNTIVVATWMTKQDAETAKSKLIVSLGPKINNITGTWYSQEGRDDGYSGSIAELTLNSNGTFRISLFGTQYHLFSYGWGNWNQLDILGEFEKYRIEGTYKIVGNNIIFKTNDNKEYKYPFSVKNGEVELVMYDHTESWKGLYLEFGDHLFRGTMLGMMEIDTVYRDMYTIYDRSSEKYD